MEKVRWKTQTQINETHLKERTFEREDETFGGLSFIEFIQYLVYRNDSCHEVWVNDTLVWDSVTSWADDFLAIRTAEVIPRNVMYLDAAGVHSGGQLIATNIILIDDEADKE